MARIPMVSKEAEDPRLKETFDGVRRHGLEIPNLYRVLGNAPDMLKAWVDFAWSLRLDATSPRSLRELIIMRGAQLTGTDYEWAHHWPMAEAAGIAAEKLHALSDWHASSLYSKEERAVLRLVDEVNEQGGASEACTEDLRGLFSVEQTVELTLTACFYVCVARLLTSLGVDLEPEFESLRPTPSSG